MDIETITEEIASNGNRKTMLGVRCYSELKLKLTEDAQKLGISLSEYCESILLNYDTIVNEREAALIEIAAVNDKLLQISSNSKLLLENQKIEIKELKEEIESLKMNMKFANEQMSLFKNKQLLSLFEIVKGKTDKIELSFGKTYSIKYDSPKDLLEAMIYSFKVKKP
jgi:L-cysteine desulfidase